MRRSGGWMVWLLTGIRWLLSLRYRVRITGLDALGIPGDPAAGGGLLFLPNHPSLIDPVILMAWLWPRFRLRPLADARQVDRPLVRGVARRLGVVTIPDATREGAAAKVAIEYALAEVAGRLEAGDNILLYPSGHASWTRYEEIGGNSGAARLARQCPSARIVRVRITGLWGSSFSRADGREPRIAGVLARGWAWLAANLVFFMPRRDVSIVLDVPEPGTLGADGDRLTFNRDLEAWYNADAPARTYVPHGWWDRGGTRELPEPNAPETTVLPDGFPEDVLAAARAAAGDRAGLGSLPAAAARLSADLGLDSLAVGELAVWVEREYRVAIVHPGGLRTVADLALAAKGLGPAMERPAEAAAPPAFWFAPERDTDEASPVPEGDTLVEAVRRRARRTPRQALWADNGKVTSYRGFMTAVHALAPLVAELPGERVGIMLPAAGAATAVFYAALWAGKTAVLFNWTAGTAALAHGAGTLGVEAILTSSRLMAKLEAGGLDFSPVRGRLRLLEEMASGLGLGAKLRAAWRGWRGAGPLRPVPEVAAVLFTSGSEALPKAVPLTHANILTNLRDVLSVVPLRRRDAILAMLPPFHSFGLLTGTVLPPVSGIRAAYSPSPLDGPALAEGVERYRLTILVGTPTFVGGILRAAGPGALAGVRWAVTGAEACSAALREAMHAAMPSAAVLEGYGITECSPILSVDDPAKPAPGTVGKALPSLRWMLVDPEQPERTVDGREAPGLLLVRGPSVFGGYLSEAPSPFVEWDGERWYATGDLIRVDGEGRWLFAGRRKRFVKLGGEMVSLPAIEAVLESRWPPRAARAGEAPRPSVAVMDMPAVGSGEGSGEAVELVAAVTGDGTREEANAIIRAAGLSGLHAVRRVMRIAEIPLLGTGKTDYRALKRLLEHD